MMDGTKSMDLLKYKTSNGILQMKRIVSNPDDESAEKSPLLEVRAIELLPELFGLLLDFERGDVQTKDFDNNLGTIRLKISMLVQKLQSLEGVCDSIKDQESSIQKLNESIKAKRDFSREFKQKIRSELSSESSLNESLI